MRRLKTVLRLADATDVRQIAFALALVALLLAGCSSVSRDEPEAARYVLMLCISDVQVRRSTVTPPLVLGPRVAETSEPTRCTEGYPSCRTWLRRSSNGRDVDRLVRDAEAREAARVCLAYGRVLDALHPSPAWTRGGAAAVARALSPSG